jgi:hypothetical protein
VTLDFKIFLNGCELLAVMHANDVETHADN